MKRVGVVLAIVMAACQPALCQSGSGVASSASSNLSASSGNAAKEAGNYVIRIEWKDAKGATNHLEVLTTEGSVSLDSVLAEKVRIDDSDIPITISLKAELRALNPEKGRLTLFLGRTVPYVTSTSQGPTGKSSSYQQLRVGLSSTFEVVFGKRLVIQSDENETVSVLVKRLEE